MEVAAWDHLSHLLFAQLFLLPPSAAPPDRKTEINGPSNGPGRGLNVTAIKGVNMKLAAGRTTETDCVCER